MKRFVSLLVLVALLVSCLSGCAVFEGLLNQQPGPETTAKAEETVEQMIERCSAACNDVDLDGILDCVTPKIADPLRAGLKLVGTLGGKSEEELLDTIVGLLGADNAQGSEEICRSLDINVVSVETKGDTAEAKLAFEFTRNGQEYIGETNVTCVCIDGRWYVSKLSV